MESMMEAYQAAVAKGAADHANANKILLRTKLGKLREEMGGSARENGIDPLLIFPEEIWSLILDNVTDWRDLASCAKGSHLFERILTPTKGQWLFGKVLPVVSKYLEKSDVLRCRSVCKHWCAGVDNNLESCKLVGFPSWSGISSISNDVHLGSPKESSNELESFVDTFVFGVPERHRLSEQDIEFKNEIDEHPRNPFVGRSVALVVEDPRPLAYIQALSKFLDIHGPNIWHLKFTTCRDFPFQSWEVHYRACVIILEKCTNLRSLTLGGVFDIVRESAAEPVESVEELLPHHLHLESLEVIMDFPSEDIPQDRLISKYSGQLKRLIVKRWKSSYSSLNWTNLRDLQIRTGISPELSENLLNMNAPNLLEFGIFIDERNRSANSLELLMRIIRHFRNLDTLKLKFLNGFCGFPIDEIVSLPQELTIAPHIQTIVLDIFLCDGVSYNFLLAFPFLKKIQKLQRQRLYLRNVSEIFFSVGPALRDIDILQISGYMEHWDGAMAPYNSKVWELLPSLQILEVNENRRSEYDADLDTVVSRITYRREGSSKMDKATFLRTLLSIAQKEKIRQQNLKRDLLRQNLESWRTEIGARTAAVETEDTGPSKEVFSSFIKYLDDQDILNCRQVCREWQSSVDTALEGYSTETTPEGYPEPAIVPRSYHPASFFDFEYSFNHNSPSRRAMSLHPRNPFIGRTACFRLTRDQQDSAEVREFVEQLGKHIWHFALSNGTVYGILLNLSQCYLMIQSIIDNCKNLRTLRLSDMKIVMTNTENLTLWYELLSENSLPKNPNLEALFLENRHPKFKKLIEALLTAYSNQLKCFRTYQWLRLFNSDMHLSWDNLEELYVEEKPELFRSFKGFLNSFTKITAPNLKILEIGYFPFGLESKLLIILINKFPKLNYLKLQLNEFYINRGLHLEDWRFMTPGLISHAALTKLEIVTDPKHNLSFQFLMFFPLLKELCIRETPGEGEPWNDESSFGSEGNEEDGSLEDSVLEEEGDYESEEENGNDGENRVEEEIDGDDRVEEENDDGVQEESDIDDHYGDSENDEVEENMAEGDYLKNEPCVDEEDLFQMVTDDFTEKESHDPEPEGNENDDMSKEMDEEQPPEKLDADFVQFPANYWEREYDEAEIYGMNFWQVMESLQSLKFSQTLPGEDQVKRVHVFTREKYDRFRNGQNN